LPLVDEASGKVTGRICHIRARSPDGRRYDPEQSEEERHGFGNLVLMCPMHHDVIDDDAETYTVEGLLEIKARHETRYAGGREPSNEVAQQFLLQFEVQVAGDFVLRDKIVYEAGAAAATSLHQLPSSPGDFTGREEELAALCRAIEQGGVTISGLRGMGGIGKTVLALKLAGQITPRYPDAQIYLDLKGTGPTPLTPEEAMAHVVRAYHPTERLPESEAGLCGLYRSVLHGQRALLLMDNAAGAAQVEPLIPPSSCVLLVTSRQRFTLPGMRAINLDTLPPPDARKLLLRIAGRIGDCADEMARLCGYLPLALRLAGSALARQEDLRPAEYLRRLEDRQARLGLVEASLSLSYDLLGEGLQRQWALLAVFPGTFEREGAAAVWGLEADRAQDGLSELLCYSLVEWDPEAERYRLHDLARLFAESRLGEADRASGRERHAVYYQTVCRAANALYERGGEWLLRGLGLFEMEWDNVEAGHRWAEENAAGNRRALELCDDYPAGCFHILPMRQYPRQQIAWLETALRAARRLDRRQAQGWHLGNLGLAYADLGEVRRAIEYHEQALAIDREIGDRHGEGADLGNLGLAYADLGEVRRAIEYYEQALAIRRAIGDRRGEGAILGNLGSAYYRLGEVRRAIEYYEQALAISREIGDRRNEGNWLGNLGLAYADLGEVRRAVEYYEQALEIARGIGDRRMEGNALGNLGLAYADLGEVRRAIEYSDQALAISREIEDRRGEGGWLGNLGLAYKNLGEVRRAIEYYEQALAISREIGDRRGEGMTLGNLGLLAKGQGDLARAHALWEQALRIFEAIEDPNAGRVRGWLDELAGASAT
jgi:tetratricopeptide (TPR) repeat protein